MDTTKKEHGAKSGGHGAPKKELPASMLSALCSQLQINKILINIGHKANGNEKRTASMLYALCSMLTSKKII